MRETDQTQASAADTFPGRTRAALEEIVAHLTDKSADLLSYEAVRQKLRSQVSFFRRALENVPLAAIAGSVDRYDDFTRRFWPRHDSDEQTRRPRERDGADSEDEPPIEVYQLDQDYFVADGNRRVSAARASGATHIEAYVTQIRLEIPRSSTIQPGDLICQAEYVGFLEHTRLDEIRPGADLTTTVPGVYWILLQQIENHRWLLAQAWGQELPTWEVVGHWYDQVYEPVIAFINKHAILKDFPRRSETDLYAWISEHQTILAEALSEAVEPASDSPAPSSYTSQHVSASLTIKTLDALLPIDEPEAGPTPGEWRKGRLAAHQDHTLFSNILVPIRGDEMSWYALDQALVVARREHSRVHGLHIVSSAKKKEQQALQVMQAEFKQRLQTAKTLGEMAIAGGYVEQKICERSSGADLVVMSSAHPPTAHPLSRFISRLGTLLRQCPRPVLAVSDNVSAMHSALLAYDGSPTAKEALFVAAYLVERWQIPLVVLTVVDGYDVTKNPLLEAQAYLESQGVAAIFVEAQGAIAETILDTAATYNNDFIIMGGYGFSPMLEVILGSAVDHVLQKAQQPVLICR